MPHRLHKLLAVTVVGLMPVVAGVGCQSPCRTCPASGTAAPPECAAPDRAGACIGSGPFLHVVLFKLKADAPEGAAEAMIRDTHELLAKVPSVKEVRTGRRAAIEGGYNLTDYDVGLLVKFADQAGLEAYIVHPLHKQYVEKHLPNCEPPRVADFIAE